MKGWLRTNPLLALTGLVGIVLVIAIALEIAFGASLAKVLDTGERKRGVPADAKLLPPLVAVGPEQAYPETVARPLFIPTRRPAPEAPAAATTTLQRGLFVLQGTIVVGDTRVAMLKEKSTGKVVRVERGKEFNGMKVVSIEKEAVTLGVGNDEEKLVLNVLKPTGTPAAPAAAAGPFAPATTPGAPPAAPAPAPGAPIPAGPAGAKPPGAPPANPGAPAALQATPAGATPATAEEMAARRRAARRAQQQGQGN